MPRISNQKFPKLTVKILHFLPQVIKISSLQTEEWGEEKGKEEEKGGEDKREGKKKK